MRRWEMVRSLAAAILAATGSWRHAPVMARWREGGRGARRPGLSFHPSRPRGATRGRAFSVQTLVLIHPFFIIYYKLFRVFGLRATPPLMRWCKVYFSNLVEWLYSSYTTWWTINFSNQTQPLHACIYSLAAGSFWLLIRSVVLNYFLNMCKCLGWIFFGPKLNIYFTWIGQASFYIAIFLLGGRFEYLICLYWTGRRDWLPCNQSRDPWFVFLTRIILFPLLQIIGQIDSVISQTYSI